MVNKLPVIINDFSKDTIYKIYTPTRIKLPFLATGVGHFKAQPNYYVERNNLNMFLLIFTIKGAGDITYRKKSFSLMEGQAILLNGMEYHKYKTSSTLGFWEFKWIRFSTKYYSVYDSIINETGINAVSILNTDLDKQHCLFIDYIDSHDKLRDFLLSDLIQRMLTTLCIASSEKTIYSIRENKIMDDCLKYIAKNYALGINLEDLAGRCNQSRSSFIRNFTKFVGITPYAYIQKMRINKSLFLIEIANKSICEIAYEVGFSDQNNFTKQFKIHTGITPMTYRKQFRSKLNVSAEDIKN